jgi:hypothetical protein
MEHGGPNHSVPSYTRLRVLIASNPVELTRFLSTLKRRVQIYGAPQFARGKWHLWFVPDDRGSDMPSMDLDKGEAI